MQHRKQITMGLGRNVMIWQGLQSMQHGLRGGNKFIQQLHCVSPHWQSLLPSPSINRVRKRLCGPGTLCLTCSACYCF